MKIKLTEEQAAAADPTFGKTVVIAGPGTGKTRVAVERVAGMVEKGEMADSFVLVTFSNRAARELRQRIEARTGRTAFGFLGTIHGLAWSILERVTGEPGALRENFTVWDQDDRLEAFEAIVKDGRLRCSAKKAVVRIERETRYSDDLLSGRVEAPQTPKDRDECRAVERYRTMKAQMNAEDYDGLVPRAVRALMENPFLLEALREEWRHLVVDEYQDVDPVQDRLIAILSTGSILARSLFIVGDPHQTLYRFRGADPALLMQHASECDQALYLRENFRASGGLVSLAVSLSECDPIGPARIFASTGHHEDRACLSTIRGADAEDEAALVAQVVTAFFESETEPMQPSDFAVLAGTHERLKLFGDVFAERGIPVRYAGQRRKLMGTRAGRLARYFIRAALNPEDKVAAAELAKFPWPFDRVREDREPRSSVAPTAAYWLAHVLAGSGAEADGHLVAGRMADWQAGTAPEDRNPAALLRWLMADQPEDDEEAEAVTLSTFHAAKGLEWPVVCIAGLADEWTPGFAADKPDGLTDARRAVYVALTRAQRHLVLSMPNRGKPSPWAKREGLLEPSRFLGEMGVDLSIRA